MNAGATDLPRIAAATALEVVEAADVGLEPEARALLEAGHSPREFLRALLEHGRPVDAARFLAHALGRREAVAWACHCARRSLGTGAGAAHTSALEAAESWVREPDEPHRRAAHAAAQACGVDSPAGCAAMAAFLSEGSIAPPGQAPVPAPAGVSAQLAACAVEVAGLVDPPEQADERYRGFLATGIEIAMGGDPV